MAEAPSRAVEVSAKNVDEAVQRALQQLGCTREEVEVEVVHPGSPGRLLGFGAEPARVRVTRTGGRGGPGGPGGPIEAAEADAGTLRRPGFASRGAAVLDRDGETDDVEAAPEGEAIDGGVPRDPARDAELGRVMLVELLQRMGVPDVQVQVTSADPMMLNVRGGDVADLIGRRGENLRALQFVLSLMLNKQLRRHVRVVVDADGYRSRREELLQGMAQRFAQRVRTMREPMQLEAMPPNERRIIHMTLADDPDVVTESAGEGDARRVVIKPRR
ncbi:MAG: Jag N-terminal domain-containing protein [Chloroflexota bacterium]|nr:Jag N-terminal domain-containing protein [Chloroflexota bacterium]